jgi:Xaa-Pro dipeptidase
MNFNHARAIDYMKQCRLDAIVATAPVSVTYVSDYFLWTDSLFREYMITPGASSNLFHNYAVFLRDGQAALVVNALLAVNAADCWIKDIHCNAGKSLDALTDLLIAKGLSGARIGIELDGYPAANLAEIYERLPKARMLDCSNLLRLIRMVKTEEEVSKLRQVAAISERAASKALRKAKPGIPVCDLTDEYRAQSAAEKANLDHFAFGIRGRGIATEPNYVLRQDDVMYIDFGSERCRYFSDAGLTLALSEPSSALRDQYSALLDSMKAGTGAMKPSARASQVCAAMHCELKRHGLSGLNPHGHGLGLEVRDYPILVLNNDRRIADDCIDVPSDLPLEAGMVLNLEVSILNAGEQSLHIEQSFIVGERGAEPLVAQDRSKMFIAD